jgi:hypothetical protein
MYVSTYMNFLAQFVDCLFILIYSLPTVTGVNESSSFHHERQLTVS